MKTIGALALAAAGLLSMTGTLDRSERIAAPGLALGQQSAEWEWSGRVDRGDAIEIKGINGDIEATGSSGSEVTVTAVKKGRKDDPEDVRIDVVEHAGGVTICAVYPDGDRRSNECAPGDGGHLSSRDNDVSVDFEVQVPAGVRFVGKTVNGGIEASSLSADAEATTVNGDIAVSTSGLARATTVNGSIHASLGRADWSGKIKFHTVNGSIRVDLPADVNADVSASTVNGGMETDFPLTVSGRFSMKNMRGTIGRGGRDLELETVNGSIVLKRS